MQYFLIEPHVPGYVSDESADKINALGIDHLRNLDRLIFVVETWPCDDIITSTPVFMISDPLAKAFSDQGFNGYYLKSCELQKDDQLIEVYPESPPLTLYHWINFTGQPLVDDFGLQNKVRLIVSARVVEVLKQFENEYCSYQALD